LHFNLLKGSKSPAMSRDGYAEKVRLSSVKEKPSTGTSVSRMSL
jgi:hypothetical protein